jgi:hypothetical protein
MKHLSKAIIATCLLATSISLAQDKQPKQEPTYEETRLWLVGKIAEAGWASTFKTISTSTIVEGDTSTTTVAESYDQISVTDCVLQFTDISTTTEVATTATANPLKVTRTVYSVPLNKVQDIKQLHEYQEARHTVATPRSDLRIDQYYDKVDLWDVSIIAPTVAKLLDQQTNVVQTFNERKAVISFGQHTNTDEDTTNRIKKALDHAVDLCKKKAEPF